MTETDRHKVTQGNIERGKEEVREGGRQVDIVIEKRDQERDREGERGGRRD